MHFTRICRLASKGASQMRAWQVQSPGESLQLKTVSMPMLTKPNQVLIKVKAASVNPVDTVMVKGYGREILGVWKKVAECDSKASRFPLIAGRDCSGVVEAIGGGVKGLRPGDEIMGVWRNSVHVSVVSPMMRDTDRYGFLLGLASTAAKHFSRSYEV
ncbi:GroES-like protein [Ancylostoma duodenale]|uniref:GroES-like protein n=1 Tax=Ancylostoma duodenale TaxID=51022 RepID=A0A0C2H2S0_9BILA|nr:GroES-like protein [Ancylostoma duodenale]